MQNDILQKELAHTSDEKMKSIISTIQREQNIIIRNERAKNMIIQGVAGSGKTSIALHRIAFLLYRFKNQLTAQDITIISPNKVFADYISNVIPELGEEPICEWSFSDIARNALKDVIAFEQEKNPLEVSDEQWKKRVQFKSTLAFLHLMEEYRLKMGERVFTANDYSYGNHIVSAKWIESRFAFYGKLSIRKRRSSVEVDYQKWQATIDHYLKHFEFCDREALTLLKEIAERAENVTFSMKAVLLRMSVFIGYFDEVY